MMALPTFTSESKFGNYPMDFSIGHVMKIPIYQSFIAYKPFKVFDFNINNSGVIKRPEVRNDMADIFRNVFTSFIAKICASNTPVNCIFKSHVYIITLNKSCFAEVANVLRLFSFFMEGGDFNHSFPIYFLNV